MYMQVQPFFKLIYIDNIIVELELTGEEKLKRDEEKKKSSYNMF